MADTKDGREEQSAREERRQQEREIREARTRSDEVEPPDDTGDDEARLCHRRGCNEPAAFVVLERYQEETGHGPVEATAVLCQTHADEESPANLDAAYEDYVFRVDPLPPTGEADTA